MIVQIKVPGIHCTGCTGRIERVLSKQAGVASVSADVNSKVVTVDYDPNLVDESALRAAIERLGFQL